MRKNLIAVAALVLALGVPLSACGGDDDNSSGSATAGSKPPARWGSTCPTSCR